MEVSELVNKLNDDVLKLSHSNYFLNQLDRVAIDNRWMGYSPVTQAQIVEKELQLETTLPKSYKDFLLTSNGFRHISPSIYELYSIEKLDWARNIEDDHWLTAIEGDAIEVSDTDYLNYSNTQRTEWFRPEHFRSSLKISGWGDACCLYLNPEIKDEGEWEVLFHATWWPGTRRYRSFKEYLIDTHQSNLKLLTWIKENRE